jgi:hypothetical protein
VATKPSWRAACLALLRRGPPDRSREEYEQWATQCPRCGDNLYVVRYWLQSTGRWYDDYSLLMRDGFGVDAPPDSIKDRSTECERVECSGCRARYGLGDLQYNTEGT